MIECSLATPPALHQRSQGRPFAKGIAPDIASRAASYLSSLADDLRNGATAHYLENFGNIFCKGDCVFTPVTTIRSQVLLRTQYFQCVVLRSLLCFSKWCCRLWLSCFVFIRHALCSELLFIKWCTKIRATGEFLCLQLLETFVGRMCLCQRIPFLQKDAWNMISW